MLEHYHDGGYTVMLAPGKGFYVTPGRGYQEVRLAYVLAEEHLTHALKVLRGALEQYPGRVEVDEAASLRAQS
jgi:aspartate aminotransferase